MANYQSKYTGAEIDNILDNAIELPDINMPTDMTKVLSVNPFGKVYWRDAYPSPVDGNHSESTFQFLHCDTETLNISWQDSQYLINFLSQYFAPLSPGPSDLINQGES